MNFQSRIDLISGAIHNIDVHYSQFTIKNSHIYTQQLVKNWSFQFDKRRIIKISDDEIDSVPFGYSL